MAGTASFDNGSQQQKPEAESAAAGYDPNYVPDSVRSFVVHIYRHIREKNVYEIHQMYETSFQSISDRFFKDSPWPSVDAVAPYVDNDHVFCLLYREMWFRHLYARHSPTLKQRIDSWDNYCSLFQVKWLFRASFFFNLDIYILNSIIACFVRVMKSISVIREWEWSKRFSENENLY